MNAQTLLHRQIHPSWVQDGQVTSQAFRPTPKDEKKLSVYDGDQISPADAFSHYTGGQGLASVGVLSVSVEECRAIDLDALPDPEPFPEHAVIDFGDLPEKAVKSKGKLLKSRAVARSWQHGPLVT